MSRTPISPRGKESERRAIGRVQALCMDHFHRAAAVSPVCGHHCHNLRYSHCFGRLSPPSNHQPPGGLVVDAMAATVCGASLCPSPPIGICHTGPPDPSSALLRWISEEKFGGSMSLIVGTSSVPSATLLDSKAWDSSNRQIWVAFHRRNGLGSRSESR